MKVRLLIGVCCLAFSALLSCVVFFYVQRVCGTLTQEAEALLEETDNASAVLAGAKALCGDWERKSLIFCAFVHHKDADELRKAFFSLQMKAYAGDLAGVRESLSECMVSLQVIREGEKPKLSNIF